MKRDSGIRFARDVVGAIPERVPKKDDIFVYRLFLPDSHIDFEIEFNRKDFIYPLYNNTVRRLLFWGEKKGVGGGNYY
jgi:hypothetical protein